MFFEETRIANVRQMMLTAPEVRRLSAVLEAAETAASQASGAEKKALLARVREIKAELKDKRKHYDGALKKLLPEQRKDFEGIFTAMDGLPVVIRLLDPPLHEFLPHDPKLQARLGKQMGLKGAEVAARVDQLREMNPMLGHRGCRLGITYPDVYNMQVRAIIQAAVRCKTKGIDVHPEIMIPLVGTDEELRVCREATERICQEELAKSEVKVTYKIGTMIEVPRAAVTADQVAQYADFFSFGTNDLTQMTYGFSRDDVGTFVPEYVDREILVNDPFQVLDQTGVGQLVQMGVQKGRSTRKDLKVGICGEHGGDPASIEFCHQAGLNYVSCSPFRVPIARLAAAQAALKNEKKGK
jgi:pyruvate,orthophosphate dikinase